VSFFLLSRLEHSRLPYTDIRSLLRTFFGILAFFDITHIGLTLADLGRRGALDPLRWNQLVVGNVVITLGLFVWRSAWFWSTRDSKRVKAE
jgi:hypothetical protein